MAFANGLWRWLNLEIPEAKPKGGPDSGPVCSGRWLRTWFPTGLADASLAPSKNGANTPTWIARGRNFASASVGTNDVHVP